MAILDVLKYEGPNDVLAWKWRSDSNSSRENQLRMGSQLIVNESQEACFYKGGKLLDVFTPGTHTLSSKNLPLLSSLIGLVYGGDSPFTAEVYFVNKAVSMDAKFGLVPFNMLEPTFKVPIPVSCRGSFAIVVKDIDAIKISKALDRDVSIFFIIYPSIFLCRYLYLLILTNNN